MHPHRWWTSRDIELWYSLRDPLHYEHSSNLKNRDAFEKAGFELDSWPYQTLSLVPKRRTTLKMDFVEARYTLPSLIAGSPRK